RLAHDDLPALLRSRCDLLRFRDGADPDADHPQDPDTRTIHYHRPYREHEQGDPADGYYRRGRLPDGAGHRLVFRIHLRTIRFLQPGNGAVLLELHRYDELQRTVAADLLVEEIPPQHLRHLCDVHLREYRYVV